MGSCGYWTCFGEGGERLVGFNVCGVPLDDRANSGCEVLE